VTTSSFTRWRSIVLEDQGLQCRLRDCGDWETFASLCSNLAARRGCPLTAADLDVAREAAVRARSATTWPEPGQLDPTVPDGWTPIEIAPDGRAVKWCDLRGIELREPFFSDTVARARRQPYRLLFDARTDAGALAAFAAPAQQLPLSGLIFHTSRCGSTLVSQMLAQLTGTVVLSEPAVVDQLLRARPAADGGRGHALAGLIGALARSRAPDQQRMVLKLDAWSTRDLKLIRSTFPGTPWLFVYRNPDEVIASHGRLPGMPGAPGVLPPELFGLDLATALAMGPAGYCAEVVATICEDALAHLDDGGLAVAYEELPAAVWEKVLPHFGIVAQVQESERMRAAARRDAKRPYQSFVPASLGPPGPAAHGGVSRRATAAYARLERRRRVESKASASC
jgi:hypothetical protein